MHINARRDDGYHELETLFTFLNFGDELTFECLNTQSIFVSGDTKGIPLTDNLIYKAALLLQTHSKTKRGVKIN